MDWNAAHRTEGAVSGAGVPPVPLSTCPLFETADLDEARERVARVYCDHRLERVGKGQVRARHNRLPGAALSVNFMEYGAKSLIAPGALETFFLFQFPLAGHATITNGSDHYAIGGGRGGVLNPDAETRMIWGEGCAQLMIQIDRRAVERLARQHFGLPQERAVRFAGAADLTTGAGRGFLDLLLHVVREAGEGRAMIGAGSLMTRQLEQTLILGLLESLPTGLRHSDVAGPPGAGPVPRVVRQAELYMEEHLQDPLTIGEIAEAVGCSIRSLQGAFRSHRGRAPLEVLRDLRLDRAWTDLSNPGAETSVTGVATTWGFYHLGRFAAQYREKFGCTPLDTLRQARSD